MKYYSIPADFKKSTIDALHELNGRYDNAKVIEIYGQVTSGVLLNSGRVIAGLPQADMTSMSEYIAYASARGIKFNYTLNPSCIGNYEFSSEGIEKLILFLGQLYTAGVRHLTVTMPSLMELVQRQRLEFYIKVSAICEITSPTKALFYKRLGAKRLVVDPDITRNFLVLKNICSTFGDGVEIIVNNVCYKNCAYKIFHYNHEAHCTSHSDDQEIKDYYTNRCSIQKAKNPVNAIKLNWIRPEDIKYYYDCGISHFKIQGRQNILSGDIIKTLECYFREDYDGSLFDLITLFSPYNAFQPYIDNKKLDGFVKGLYDSPGFCRDMCHQCGYCSGYAEKSINMDETQALLDKALAFFNQFDKYSKMVSDAGAKDAHGTGVCTSLAVNEDFDL